MAELVSLKQLSFPNQLYLPETYALNIFTSNLKLEIRQCLQLFKPKSLVEGDLVARQVETILSNSSRKLAPVGIRGQPRPPSLFPTVKTNLAPMSTSIPRSSFVGTSGQKSTN
ncbi:hypothetical protein ES332_D04G087400v1 [Gossypium tomentosum]|uniref:Uncharacterized protein n=1 Tax=Gossypium tomentosum TaxID=34277 RepID=A0A5D2LBH8_GOSTO|nr:hypothetical protein ES332_D04G087400v1 [Gossypium tomentosum]